MKAFNSWQVDFTFIGKVLSQQNTSCQQTDLYSDHLQELFSSLAQETSENKPNRTSTSTLFSNNIFSCYKFQRTFLKTKGLVPLQCYIFSLNTQLQMTPERGLSRAMVEFIRSEQILSFLTYYLSNSLKSITQHHSINFLAYYYPLFSMEGNKPTFKFFLFFTEGSVLSMQLQSYWRGVSAERIILEFIYSTQTNLLFSLVYSYSSFWVAGVLRKEKCSYSLTCPPNLAQNVQKSAQFLGNPLIKYFPLKLYFLNFLIIISTRRVPSTQSSFLPATCLAVSGYSFNY